MADDKNPVATSTSDQPKDAGSLKSESKGVAGKPAEGAVTALPTAPDAAIAPFNTGLDAGAVAGTPTDVAVQGFSATKLQQDQQALPSHEGEGVPMGGNPLKNEFKDPNRKDAKARKVAGTRFSYGGSRFAKGETIYLTDAEAAVLKNHLE